MAYDPYKAAEEIVRNKGRWGTAVANGESGEEYHRRALYYYQELRDNGYSGVADKLEASSYGEALAVLDGLEKDTGVYSAEKELSEASAEREGVMYRQNELYDKLRAEYDALAELEKSGKRSEYAEDIYERFKTAGENAALHAVADNAAGNSGNVSSYAAANAHRQMIDYLTAGEEAAYNADREKRESVLDVLDSMSSGLGGILDSSADIVNDKAITAADKYGTDNGGIIIGDSGDAVNTDSPGDTASERISTYIETLISMYPKYKEEIKKVFGFLG